MGTIGSQPPRRCWTLDAGDPDALGHAVAQLRKAQRAFETDGETPPTLMELAVVRNALSLDALTRTLRDHGDATDENAAGIADAIHSVAAAITDGDCVYTVGNKDAAP